MALRSVSTTALDVSDSIVNITVSVSKKQKNFPDHNIQLWQYVGGWSMWLQNVPGKMIVLGCKYQSCSYNTKTGIIPVYVIWLFFFIWPQFISYYLSQPFSFEAMTLASNNRILNVVIVGTAIVTGSDIYIAVISTVAMQCICASLSPPSVSISLSHETQTVKMAPDVKPGPAPRFLPSKPSTCLLYCCNSAGSLWFQLWNLADTSCQAPVKSIFSRSLASHNHSASF